MRPRFLSVGDTAVVVEFGTDIDRKLSRRVLRLDRAVRADPPKGVVETVPTFCSLTVHYDPLVTSRAELEAAITGRFAQAENSAAVARLWRIPVCYDPEFAPDLAAVAQHTGIGEADIIAQHSAIRFHVYMLGFLPGFPYMGDLPAQLALPRRADPRTRVPAGSIAIATTLTAIYPYESPGGWHLIGATPLRFFDPSRNPPSLLAAGDAVMFEPIAAERFASLHDEVENGSCTVESEPIAE